MSTLLWLPAMASLLSPPWTMSLFQEVILTKLLCICSAPVTPPIFPAKSPIGNLLPLSYKNLVFLRSNANFSNLILGGSSPEHE